MKLGSFELKNFGTPYLIAEIGANHNGDMALARKLIDAAKESGSHCAKFQSWTKESLFTKKMYAGNSGLETAIDDYSVTEEELAGLKKYCDEVKIDFASTPFSRREADFLADKLDVKFFKIASMDVNNLPLLEHIAKKRKPIVISTGLSTLGEIDAAIRVIESTGNRDICILHCIAVYPPKDEDVNLNNIDMLRDNYPDYPIGFSDHSVGTALPLASVAKGACLIEKHFTLDKDMPGWDHKVSANPAEMSEIAHSSARIVKALGSYRRTLSNDEKKQILTFRRSIVAAKPIPKGKKITPDDLDSKRPGTGIEPKYLDLVVGRTSKRDIGHDELLQPDDF